MRINALFACLTRVKGTNVVQRVIGNNLASIRYLSSLQLPKSPIFEAITRHDPESTAIIHSVSDRTFCYGHLSYDVAAAKDRLHGWAGGGEPQEGKRIAFLAENGYDYVVTLLAILAADAVAVPLSPSFPNNELHYILNDCQASLLLSTERFRGKAQEVVRQGAEKSSLRWEILSKLRPRSPPATPVSTDGKPLRSAGFMLYTSGTTNRPKGIIHSVPTITAQAQSLIKAWKYSPSDLLLHVLPLHHIHGTLNALFTPLMAGSAIEFAYPFSPDMVWTRLAAPFMPHTNTSKKPITFFNAVPTIYSRLLSTHPDLHEELRSAGRAAISPNNLRLNVSGSAALPTPIKAAWTQLSRGNVLLERYGMTEVGMALSCGLSSADRVDGSVGWPLPSVQVRLMDDETGQEIRAGEEINIDGKLREGEIQLRGPTIFTEYYGNPEATAKEFIQDTDGKGKWFKTGDVAVRQHVDGTGLSEQPWAKGPMYFIRGRRSVDIIKTAGEKVSALEVERELLSLPEVSEVAIIGLPSLQWGQKVAAVIVLTEAGKTAGKKGKAWSAMDMRRALRDKLANFKIPQELKVVESIPRNAMGKINKKILVKEVFG